MSAAAREYAETQTRLTGGRGNKIIILVGVKDGAVRSRRAASICYRTLESADAVDSVGGRLLYADEANEGRLDALRLIVLRVH